MNLRNKVSFLLLSFVSVPLFAQTPQQELERLQQNYIQSFVSNDDRTVSLVELLSGIQPETEISDQVVVELHQRYPFNVEKITGYMETIREDGSWPDINYNDQKRSGWSVKEHADRVLELAKLYRAEEGDCHWGPKLESVIHLALGYWFREKPVCKNWWYNQIGVPKTLGPAFLLMKEQLNPEEKEAAVEVMENARFGMTGQNKVWLAGNVLMRGLLQDDFELVKAARDTIVSEITTGMQEGIKSDWSFHQHGPQQQFGNYGLAFLTEMSSYSGLFAGTVFALNKEQQGILNSFLLNGYRWIVWKGYMDVNALDRQLFHSGQIHKAFSLAFATNALMRGSSAEDIRQMNEFLKDNYAPKRKGSAFIGHKHFWDSDQTVHRSSTWMASVKMASDRVIGTELVNEDNLKGFYMGDGALYTYCRGDEYLNIFPFWDWRKIPGITAYESEAPVPAFFNYGAHVRNKAAFVGGVTDGETGMTAMVLDRDGLQAHKSWIFTRDYVLCLGAGIRSDSILAVTTSVDQRVKRGDLLRYADGNWLPVQGKYVSSPKEQRFFHDNTGYILLQPSACVAISEKRSGRWCDFMGSYAPKTVEGEIVGLYIDHGREDNADYQYLVLPASTAEKTAAFAVQDIRGIRNDTSIQAVAVGNCFYVTAYESQVVNLQKDLQVDLQTPGIYMFRLHNGNWLIEAADPTHKQHSLSLKMNRKDVKIVFPPCHEPVKMASDRVIGTELVNEDNLKGFYMGDGALYTYCRGDEYLNIFPFWDWRKIPGITAYESEAPVPAFFNYGAHVRNKAAFVGGVTDGETGMTAMVLDRDGLQAHKSWIFTRDYVLCLGAGIRSDSILAVTTSVDQRVKRGDLLRYADGNWLPVQGKYVSSPKEQRFFHDNTGYILLQPSACVAISEKRSGRWCDFMGSYAPKTVEGEIVGLYIDHGREDNADYQYLVLPASTAEKTAAFAVQDIRGIRNDTSIQAVAVGNCFYVTAYESQVVNLQKDLQVDLQTPGIYMFRLHNGNWLIEAADPTHKQHSLSLKMNRKDVKIVFPPCHEPGKSISAGSDFHILSSLGRLKLENFVPLS